VGADGVHLGQEDGPLSAARALLGDEAIIGRSTHSPEQALAAAKEGFDYIGIGPVFLTPTKPAYRAVGLELVRFAAKNVAIPFVAIGGIDASNVRQVRAAGARAVAVVRAVMAAERPDEAARQLLTGESHG
jgi:thiamine-phosphate pyrophosphorylase